MKKSWIFRCFYAIIAIILIVVIEELIWENAHSATKPEVIGGSAIDINVPVTSETVVEVIAEPETEVIGPKMDEIASSATEIMLSERVDALEKDLIIAQEELIAARNENMQYASEQEAHLLACENSYPTATAIYKALIEVNFSDKVACGIIGNIMSECGYSTLALHPEITNSYEGTYGICQWKKAYHGNVYGAGLEEQIKYLIDTMPLQFDTYGYLYASGFNYEAFLSLDSTEEAALAFAKVYERCAYSQSGYANRQLNALRAYEFFVE